MWKSVSVNVTVRCKVDKAVAVYSVCVVRSTQTHLLLIDGRLIQDGGEGLCKVSCRVSVSHLRGLLRVKAKVWIGARALVDRRCRVSCVQRGRILSIFLFYFLDAFFHKFVPINRRYRRYRLLTYKQCLQIIETENNNTEKIKTENNRKIKKQNSRAVKFHL